MKTKKIKRMIFLLPLLLSLGSCEKYLDIPSEATITEAQVFGTYNQFQGYLDQIYPGVLDHLRTNYTWTGQLGGECVSPGDVSTSYKATRGAYNTFGRGYYDMTVASNGFAGYGIWGVGWKAIRMCNIGLKNMDQLVATPDEKKWIKGQMLFFRAYFHMEILNAWGPVPYLKEALSDDVRKPRYYEYKGKKNYQATAEYIVEDFTEAATLLPIAWPDKNINLGRLTALAALSYKAKTLLYAGSPLMNENSGGAAEVNKEYMQRAAIAADEAIKMAESNPESYGLVDAVNYFRNFATTDKTVPWTSETVLALHRARFGSIWFGAYIDRTDVPQSSVFGSNINVSTPTQNYVDKFEMADGTLYDPAKYDNDTVKRWDFRDPRFRRAIYVDRDEPCDTKKLEMFLIPYVNPKNPSDITIGATMASADKPMTPYVIRKYWPKNVSSANGVGIKTLSDNFTFSSPQMRLADVYLMYAEASNWAYGNGNNGDVKVPNGNNTALEAVNKVRTRIGMVPTTATGGAHGNFHKMVMNERAVEMCFESNLYWNDIRRYKIGETLNGTDLLTFEFAKVYKLAPARRVALSQKMVFEKRNYWLPFDAKLTQIYDGFPQNEGWN